MKAVQLLGEMGSPRIVTNSAMEKPTPTGCDILVSVFAAGVTGDAVTWPETYATPSRIPGHEVSGSIAAFGPDYAGGLVLGQLIYAFISAERGQGQADFVVCSPNEVAPKPTTISHAEAAALPIPLLTAWEALKDHGNMSAGMGVLVTGASGAVGSLSVQMAAQVKDSRVIALASSQHHKWLQTLGATETIDYKTEGWEATVQAVDVVFDTVGGDILTKAWNTIKDRGIIITVGDPAPAWAFGKAEPREASQHPNARYKYFIVSPNAKRLAEAATLVDEGGIKSLAVERFSFDDASEAWAFARRRGRGKKAVIDFEGKCPRSGASVPDGNISP
ncbi:zinc-binding oxidoreductase like protein [Verticillium longisporum]|uniref:Zinc-binding oxidoreductase like protein n=1 Tax=Verticillium longisporum TaxID=100787 RepID=A0A8I2ZVB8_VERLO|nr:hypothetical protein VdG1_05104 [Verticillium dahliae VDG1]KAG7137828.1 zinc-binding oxidoreductase like protein [Verticillium longisporum]RBQ89877.1 hypothetical protein VDGD_07911 [Verticillium dahliae]